MAQDETSYDVWVEWDGHDRLQTIASVACILGLQGRAVRETLDQELPLASGAHALDVVRLHSKLRAIGLGIRVRPEFRWRLPDA